MEVFESLVGIILGIYTDFSPDHLISVARSQQFVLPNAFQKTLTYAEAQKATKGQTSFDD
jgi:hypothetical protein